MRDAAARVREAATARPRHVGLAGAVVGLIAGPVDRRLAGFLVLAAVIVGGLGGRPALGLLAGVALLTGGAVGAARLAAVDHTTLPASFGRDVHVRGVLVEAPRPMPFGGWSAQARLVDGPGPGERVVLRSRTAAPPIDVGDEVAVSGRLGPLRPGEAYQRLRGAHAGLAADTVRPTGRRRGGLAGFVDALRRRAERGVTHGLPPAQAALARGMVLGQDQALDGRTREDFRDSGLAHLLAASGQNVTLLALFAIAVLTALGVGLHGRLVGALALVAVYVPLAGGGPSIQRAGIMGGAGLVAALAGRPGSRLYALGLAAVATLVLNPHASGDVGWQLSFAAVASIALLAPRCAAALSARRLPEPLAEGIAVACAATAGTAPIIAAHFGRLSAVSLPANVVVAAAVAPVVWLGTASALLGQFVGVAGFGPVAAALTLALNTVAAFPLGFVGLIAHGAASLPGATAPVVLAGPLALIGAYALLGAVSVSRRVRRVAAGGALAVAGAAAWAHAHPPSPPPGLRVSFLDIGQGDATLIQHGSAAMLVDTGPPGAPVVARLRAAGVRRLDLLVLTHAQADHEGGAPAILDDVPVGTVLDGADGVTTPSRETVRLAEVAHRVRVAAPDAGEVVRVGPLSLQVLWPRAQPTADHAGEDPNARAIVALVRDGGFRMLLTSDAESDVTLPLDLPPVDVLKVAHHGSADPGLPALLERLHPSVAAIEVGAHNPYGHPSPSTIAALRAIPRVVRTDRDGTIRLSVTGGRMTLTTHA